MEFKVNQPPKIALEQIKQNDYFRKFAHDSRRLFLLGISFDSEKRDLRDDCKIEEVKK